MARALHLSLAALGLLTLSACGGCEPTLHATGLPPLSGRGGSFDGLEIDQAARRLYLADRSDSGVDLLDLAPAPARYLKTIPLGASPNGLAAAPDLGRLFVGLSGGTVAVVDTDPGSTTRDQVIARIQIGGPEADLLDYGAERHRLYVGSGSGGEVISIDPASGEVRARWRIGSPVEQPRYDPADGMVYVSSPDADAVFQINPEDGTLQRRYALGGCLPSGLAINPRNQLAVLACAGSVLRLDLKTGTRSRSVEVPGGDIVTFSRAADRFLVASPHTSRPSLVGIYAGDGSFLGSVATNGQGKAAAFDETHHLVYTADQRSGRAGVVAFALPTCAQPSPEQSWLIQIGIYVAPFLILGVVLFIYGRRRASRAASAGRR